MLYAQNVTLENGVKKLGLASFSGYNLSKVTLPDTLLDWGIMPFGTTTAIEYVLKGDNVNYVQEDGINLGRRQDRGLRRQFDRVRRHCFP